MVLLAIVLGVGILIYEDKSAQSNYEGADEPGYYYPDEVREVFLSECKEGLGMELKKSRASISENDLERFCKCVLDEFENRFSYKEFKNKYVKAMSRSTEHLPPELEDALVSCVHQIDY